MTIPHYRMAFPAADRESFVAYRAMLAPVFDAVLPDRAAHVQFETVVDTFALEDMFVSQAHGSPVDYRRTSHTIARSGVEEIIVNVYERGGRSLEIDGVEQTIAPGDIVVLDMARTANIRSDAYVNTSLTMSRRRLEPRLGDLEAMHGHTLREGAVHALLLGHIRTLCAASHEILQEESGSVSAVTFDVVAACLQQSMQASQKAAASLPRLSLIKAFVERQLASADLGPAMLMREFNLSKPRLYRLFEPLGGVAAYIQKRRLHRAFRLMVDPSNPARSIAEIASEAGFTSPTAFGRSFREVYAMTPSEAKALAWRPLHPEDSPWRIPKIAERFVAPFDEGQRDVVRRFVEES